MTVADTQSIPLSTGVELEVLDVGAGPPLLLVCGTAQDLRLYSTVTEALSSSRRVIAYNHRGIGTSSRGAGAITIASLARDLAALIDALGIERADVLGWSLGSAVAQELVLAHPQRVASLILVSTWARTSRYQQAVIRALAHPWAAGDRDAALEALSVAFSERFVNSPAFADVMASIEPLFPSTPEAIATVAEQWAADRTHDTLDRLPMIGVPTLVVAAEHDLLTPLGEGRQVAQAIPHAQLHMFTGDGSSHAALLERGGDFLAVVEGFLARAQQDRSPVRR